MVKRAGSGGIMRRLCFGWHGDATRAPSCLPLPFATGLPRSNAEDAASRRRHFELVGNKGFLVVGEATTRLFECDRENSAAVDLRRLVAAGNPEKVAEAIGRHFDALVLGMAYEINPQADYSALLPFFEALPIPVVTLGLSVSDESLDPATLHPSVMHLLHLLSQRAVLFGVRAESTRAWLDRHGVTGSVPLGCPSLHLYPRAILDLSVPQVSADDALFATGGYLFRDEKRTRDLARLFDGRRVDYILQDEIFALADEDVTRIPFDDATREFSAKAVNEKAHAWLKLHLPFHRYFLFDEMDSWRQNVSFHDCYVGDRFHGAVVAIQTRQPAVVICKDIRSRELASFYGLPSSSLEAAVERGLQDLLNHALSPRSIAHMKAVYRERAEAFERWIAEVDLKLNVQIETFSPSASQFRSGMDIQSG